MRNHHSLAISRQSFFEQPGEFGISKVDMSTTGFVFSQSIDDIAQSQKGSVDVGAFFEPFASVL